MAHNVKRFLAKGLWSADLTSKEVLKIVPGRLLRICNISLALPVTKSRQRTTVRCHSRPNGQHQYVTVSICNFNPEEVEQFKCGILCDINNEFFLDVVGENVVHVIAYYPPDRDVESHDAPIYTTVTQIHRILRYLPMNIPQPRNPGLTTTNKPVPEAPKSIQFSKDFVSFSQETLENASPTTNHSTVHLVANMAATLEERRERASKFVNFLEKQNLKLLSKRDSINPPGLRNILDNKSLTTDAINVWVDLTPCAPGVMVFKTYFWAQLDLVREVPPHLVDERWSVVLTGTAKWWNPTVFWLLIVPIYVPGHWILASIDILHKSITIYDSWEPNAINKATADWQASPHASDIKLLKQWITKEYERHISSPIRWDTWTVDASPDDQPFQDNLFDCGVYVSALLSRLARGVAVNLLEPRLRTSINPTNIFAWRLEMLEKMQGLPQVPSIASQPPF